MTQIQAITSAYDVQIKFPERDFYEEEQQQQAASAAAATAQVDENGEPIASEQQTNGTPAADEQTAASDASPANAAADPAEPERVRACDIIRITGNPETCRKVHDELIALIPVTEEVNVPFDLHRSIIGQRGRDVRDLMSRYDVHIELSPQNEQLDIIKISGTPANIADAKVALEERVRELEGDRRDRELRSFTLTFEVDNKWHPKIIGRRGAVVNKIREDHGVQLRFPAREVDEEERNTIVIQGYEEAANAAKADIMKIVEELDSQTEETVEIDARVHARIIGQRGRGIRQVMLDFGVDIKFPRDAARQQGGAVQNPDLVTIIGQADAVADAKDHLLNMEEEYLQDVIDAPQPPKRSDFSAVLETAFNQNRGQAAATTTTAVNNGAVDEANHNSNNTGGERQPQQNQSSHNQSGGKKQGFVVSGAPWEQQKGGGNNNKNNNKKAPNTSSQQDFPSFGVPLAAHEQAPITSAWGQRH